MSRSGYCCLTTLSGLIYSGNTYVLFLLGGPSLPVWVIFACWVWVFFGLLAMHLYYNTPLSKIVANSPQASHQIQTTSSMAAHYHHQQQSGDSVAATDSNARDGPKQTLRKARRSVISHGLAVGIIPAFVLFGLYGFLYAYHHREAGERNCNRPRSDTDSYVCATISIKLFYGIAAVVWLLVDVAIRSKMEWRRWKKWDGRDGEIELGRVQPIEAKEQSIQQ